jgi:elongation factor P--beta-lysine ligase
MRGDNRTKRAYRRRREALTAALARTIAAGLPLPSGVALGRIARVSNVTGSKWRKQIIAGARDG